MSSDPKGKKSAGDTVPSESVSRAASELNNLLQIISGTSAEIEKSCESSGNSGKYLDMLQQSIERAESVAAQLAQAAGGVQEKTLMHPELSPFLKPRTVAKIPAAKPGILVVDDEEMTLTLIKQILVNADHNVTTAQSGFECLDLFRRRPLSYQLVLVDLTMPFMDGEETFHRLREIRADIPVILCTGFIQRERLNALMKAGLTGYLRKPLAPDEIVSNVRSILASVKYSRTGENPFQSSLVG
ncbi:MAG TPA: response regulator [Chthoniobacterales bacterium]|nr:response regulator [Chthoniobacterales bacterium]